MTSLDASQTGLMPSYDELPSGSILEYNEEEEQWEVYNIRGDRNRVKELDNMEFWTIHTDGEGIPYGATYFENRELDHPSYHHYDPKTETSGYLTEHFMNRERYNVAWNSEYENWLVYELDSRGMAKLLPDWGVELDEETGCYPILAYNYYAHYECPDETYYLPIDLADLTLVEEI